MLMPHQVRKCPRRPDVTPCQDRPRRSSTAGTSVTSPAEPVAGWTPWGESTVPGIRGHVANSGAEPDSAAFIGTALRELLAHG